MVTLFKTTVCPKCKLLKGYLESIGVEFNIFNVDDPEGLTEMFAAGIYAREVPVLLTDNGVLLVTDLFKNNKLDEELIKQYVQKQ